jgi:molybdopterin-binding protein
MRFRDREIVQRPPQTERFARYFRDASTRLGALWTPPLTRSILRGMTLSARNRLKGKVVEIQFGGIMAHVVVRVGKNLIESVITKRSADEMKLKVGDTVSAVIKSTEVMLEKN